MHELYLPALLRWFLGARTYDGRCGPPCVGAARYIPSGTDAWCSVPQRCVDEGAHCLVLICLVQLCLEHIVGLDPVGVFYFFPLLWYGRATCLSGMEDLGWKGHTIPTYQARHFFSCFYSGFACTRSVFIVSLSLAWRGLA